MASTRTDYISLKRPKRPRVWLRALFTLRHSALSSHILACLAGIGLGLFCLVSPWIALVALAGVVFCVVALSKPIALCYLMIAAISLTGGVERGRLLPLVRPNEVSLLLSVGLAFPAILANKQRRVHISGYVICAFVLLVSGTVFIPGVSYYLRGSHLTMGDIFTLLAPLQYILLFWLFAYVPENESERRGLIQWMLFCGSIVAIVGLMQAAGIGFVTTMLTRWYASSHTAGAVGAGRVTSLMAAWNALGTFLMINILIAWAVLLSNNETLSRVNIIVSIALSVACLLASGSFAGTLGLMMGILLIEVLTRLNVQMIFRLLMGGAGVGIVYLLFQSIIEPLIRQRLRYQFRHGGTTPQTLVFRFKVWRETFWPVIRQNYLWGAYLTLPSILSWQYFESQYIFLWLSFGIVGLLAHLVWVGATLGWLYRRFHQSDGFSRAVVISALTILVVLSVMGFTNAVFTFSGAVDYLWIVLALVAGSEEVARR